MFAILLYIIISVLVQGLCYINIYMYLLISLKLWKTLVGFQSIWGVSTLTDSHQFAIALYSVIPENGHSFMTDDNLLKFYLF